MRPVVVCFFVASCGASGQTPAAPPAFDVASVKPATATDGHASHHNDHGVVRMMNTPLRQYIQMAFDVRDFQISGPDWMTTERFDIFAKTDPNATDDQINAMLRTLLAGRFGLAFHRETRQLPLYALVVARNGPKLKVSEASGSQSSRSKGQITAQRMSLPQLADALTRQLDRPVMDQTGLDGFFDFELKWEPENPAAAVASSGLSLFDALPEQLGLKLQPDKRSADLLVIDHVARAPVAN